MKRISKQVSQNGNWTTPEVLDYGLFMKSEKFELDKIMSFVIMPKYFSTAESLFLSNGLNRASILELGKAILTLLEKVHSAGYTYNDLKLKNIMFGNELPTHA